MNNVFTVIGTKITNSSVSQFL